MEASILIWTVNGADAAGGGHFRWTVIGADADGGGHFRWTANGADADGGGHFRRKACDSGWREAERAGQETRSCVDLVSARRLESTTAAAANQKGLDFSGTTVDWQLAG